MKFLLLCAAVVLPFRSKSPLTPELYKIIDKYCRAATHSDGQRYEELYDAVFEKLLANDCKLLHGVKSDEPMASWVKNVVRTTSIDLFRKIAGRPNWQKLGEHSQLICKLALSLGNPAEEVQRLLKEYPPNVEISLQEIDRIISNIEGMGKVRFLSDDTLEIEQSKSEDTNMIPVRPDEALSIKERTLTLRLFLMRLSGDDKFLISSFFGLEEEKMSLKEIAEILRSTETALQKQKNRLFEEFHRWMQQQKLSLDELTMQQTAGSAQ